MTTIATFTTPEEAHLFRMWLATEGVEGFVQDEHFVQLFWYYSQAIGGVRVMVNDTDRDAAIKAGETYMASLRSAAYPLRPMRAWPVVLFISILAGIPLPLFGRHPPRGTAE